MAADSDTMWRQSHASVYHDELVVKPESHGARSEPYATSVVAGHAKPQSVTRDPERRLTQIGITHDDYLASSTFLVACLTVRHDE